MGSRGNMDDFQFIVVASDDSEGINNTKEWYAQITVWKKQKTIQLLIPEEWSVRQIRKKTDLEC